MTNTNKTAAQCIIRELAVLDADGTSPSTYSRCGDVRTALTYWTTQGSKTAAAIDALGYPAAVDLFLSTTKTLANRRSSKKAV